MSAPAMTKAEVQAEIDRCQDACRRLIIAHPRAERIIEMADGITPLDLTDDCRRAVATIRYHQARIAELEEQLELIDATAAAAAHRAACLKEIA